MAKRKITGNDIYNLPDFLRVEFFDNKIQTNDWTELEIDDEVFDVRPSETKHITYRLSLVKVENRKL